MHKKLKINKKKRKQQKLLPKCRWTFEQSKQKQQKVTVENKQQQTNKKHTVSSVLRCPCYLFDAMQLIVDKIPMYSKQTTKRNSKK